MLLHVRSVSTSVAVVCFFAIAAIGWISDLSAATCCKRAVIAGVVAYAVAALAVKLLNGVLMDAIVQNQMNKHEDETSDSAS